MVLEANLHERPVIGRSDNSTDIMQDLFCEGSVFATTLAVYALVVVIIVVLVMNATSL